MDATTGTGPLHGVDDIDWAALAPEDGADIPGLLRGIAGDASAPRGLDDSVSALFDLIRFPAPAYAAAPRVAEYLLRIACHPDTPADWRARPLSLLLELLVPTAAATLPARTDIALWRDEVAWAAATDAEKVRDQYRAWLEEAPDEQQYRRMLSRLDTASRENGAALLQAELDVYDTVRDHAGDLAGLLDGRENRRGIDPPAEWASYLLAFVPDTAETALPPLKASLAEAAPALPGQAPPPLGTPQHDVLSAELFAIGMLAAPDDAGATVALAHEMASGHLYNGFAAAMALTVIHGEKTPEECLVRLRAAGRTSVGYPALFDDSWPHCGENTPATLGFLALGRAGERARPLRLAMLPKVLASAEGTARAAVAATALESVLGPRSAAEAPDPEADFDDDTLKVFWAIAELPADGWDDGLPDALAAWGLPTGRADFRAFAGVEDDAGDEPPADGAPAQAPAGAAQQRPQGGLFSRLFGPGS
ncbi:hypothetical protein ACFOVU_04825 [Nocardiopsis sediminis]|uniref:Uncharacterized protein n=1 Tax=Nocardiopsis sediminis TaxID=1778267 RepID=A0ABV8FIP2_9ACTN